jgi:hypothetical protein
MMTLIAEWSATQDAAVDMPIRVIWENGRRATSRDYIRHQRDTHELVVTTAGVEMRMYPGLVADVRYDYYTGVWWVVPPGEEPVALALLYEATNEEIVADLARLPRVYRAVIHRGANRTESNAVTGSSEGISPVWVG